MKHALHAAFLFFFLFQISFLTAQQNCVFPTPLADQLLVDETEDCSGCSGCSSLPENPIWDDMMNDVPNPSGVVLFAGQNGQGISGSGIMNEVNNNPNDFPPNFGGAEAVAFGNMIDSNSDIGALVDCMNLNCLVSLGGGFSPIGSFTEILDFVATDSDAFNQAMSQANPDYPIGNQSWIEVLSDVSDTKKQEFLNQANNLITNTSNNYNALAEDFYGVNDIGTSSEFCPSPNTVQGGGNGTETITPPTGGEVDVFSNAIPGLDQIGNDQLLPGPSGLNMIDQVQVGVDLYNGLPNVGASIYNLSSNDISVPVSLSYKGGGVKVNDYGTEVGNNWSLNVGQISRVVSGLPDEYEGTSSGSGMGLINVLKPCINLTGGGMRFFTPHKQVEYKWQNPTVIKFHPIIARGVITIPAPVPIIIPWEVAIQITTEINVTSKPGRISYEEAGLGYLHLKNSTKMITPPFKLGPLDLESFNGLLDGKKEKILGKKFGNRKINDIKFLSPKIQWAMEFWSGLTNLAEEFLGNGAIETRKTQKLDTEPDEFYFNFGNYSGKFVFDQDGEIHTIPHTDLKIEKTIGNLPGNTQDHILYFKVTTPTGIVYHFGREEADGVGVEISEQTNYTLPNQFTYPENTTNKDGTQLQGAEIDETQVQYSANALCWPRSLLYGSTYENNFTIMNSPKYASTWKLTKVESLISHEQINLSYLKVNAISYYSQKSLNHTFPNFGLSIQGGAKFSTLINDELNPRNHIFETEWQNGKANLTYSVTENHLTKVRLTEITGMRGEKLVFNYGTPRVDIINDELLTRIDLLVKNSKGNNYNYSKGWKFEYEDVVPNVNINCASGNKTGPVYSSPDEFKINLGEKHEKKIFPRFFFPQTWVQWFNVPKPITIPIPRPQVENNMDNHHSMMTEFGSLVEVKAYNDYLALDMDAEIAKFRGEKARSFLKRIIEIKRPEGGGGNPGPDAVPPLAEFDYLGTLGSIPKRFSMNQDLWGYYNDNNASLSNLPKIKYRPVNSQYILDINESSDVNLKEHFSFNSVDSNSEMWRGHNEEAIESLCEIGALEQVTFSTGGYKRYDYELNDWPDWICTGTGSLNDSGTPESLGVDKGAGLRVSSLTESSNGQGDNITRTTTYDYENPTIINKPIRISQNNYNKTGYDIESYIITSSTPLNVWEMNKSHYVGYGEVSETISGNGKIDHYFTTPPICTKYADIQRLSRRLKWIFSSNTISSEIVNAEKTEPFPPPQSRPWRYGLEEETIAYKKIGDGNNITFTKVQETQNSFVFDINELDLGIPKVEGTGRIYGIKAQVFQQNYPGSWWQNFNVGQLTDYIPPTQAFSNPDHIQMIELANTILNAWSLVTSFVHPFRYIDKHYFHSTYYCEVEQVRLTSSVSTTHFDDGSYSGSSSVTKYEPYSNTSGVAKILRPTQSVTTFSNGQVSTQELKYINDLNTLEDAKMHTATRNALKAIGLAGYGAPIKTEVLENGIRTGGSISAMHRIGTGQIVPYANWTVRAGEFVLGGLFWPHHPSGLPTRYLPAKHSALTTYTGQNWIWPYPEFTWDDNLQLTQRKTGSFTEDYGYNGLKELVTHSDVDGITSTFSYDDRGRLEESTGANGRATTTHAYSFLPNFVETETEFSDGSPTQSSRTTYNGLAMPLAVKRSDGAMMTTTTYDNSFRPVAVSQLGSGTNTTVYENSPLSRVESTSDAVDNEAIFTYHGEGGAPNAFSSVQSTIEVTSGQAATSIVYSDAFGRTLKSISGEGGATSYSYGPLGRLSTITNPVGDNYEYKYNAIDQVYEKTIPGGGTTTTWWDRSFRPIATEDANGTKQFFRYDSYHRPSSTYLDEVATLPSANSVFTEFAFNTHHQTWIKWNVYDANHTWLKRTFDRILKNGSVGSYKKSEHTVIDDLGRPTTVDQTYNISGATILNSINTVFNSPGQVTTQATNISGAVSAAGHTYNYAFDDLLRLVDTRLTITKGGINTEKLISRLGYNSQDHVRVKYLGETNVVNQFLQKVDYAYDVAGRLLTINSPGEAECFADQEFCQLTAEVESVNGQTPMCTSITGMTFNGQSFPFGGGINIQNTDNEAIQTAMATALDHFGLFGEVEVTEETVNGGVRYLISILSTNAKDPILNLQGCSDITFEESECCHAGDFNPPASTGIPTTLNNDLYYQKNTFDKISISRIELASDCVTGLFRNDYTYDLDQRVKTMTNKIFQQGNTINGRYNTSYTYDAAGNIKTLGRNGQKEPELYGPIDELEYFYNNQRLESVSDYINQPSGFKANSTYSYDDNGNVTNDSGKGLKINYNLLNLPSLVTGGGTMNLEYTITGEKIRKVTSGDSPENDETRIYIGGTEIVNSEGGGYHAEALNHGDGRVILDDAELPLFQYKIADHLGNTVVLFEDKDDNGEVNSEDSDPETAEVLQRNLYYPFGLAMEGEWGDMTTPNMDYLYNGKELNSDFDLNWSDYGARYYDASIARWSSVDPLAGKNSTTSPYTYVVNNPLIFVDPDGRDHIYYMVFQKGTKLDTKNMAKRSQEILNNNGINLTVQVLFVDEWDKNNNDHLDKTDRLTVFGNSAFAGKAIDEGQYYFQGNSLSGEHGYGIGAVSTEQTSKMIKLFGGTDFIGHFVRAGIHEGIGHKGKEGYGHPDLMEEPSARRRYSKDTDTDQGNIMKSNISWKEAASYDGGNSFLPGDLEKIQKNIPAPASVCGPGPCHDVNVPKDNLSSKIKK